MEHISDKSSFQIILQSDNEDDLSSEYWQGQCWYLYDELSRALPEGSIKPLTLRSSTGERADITTFFHAIIIEITAKIFVEITFEAIKNWHYYRPEANVEIKCPDGSTVKITKQSIQELQKYLNENPHLSICEAVNLFYNSDT